MKKIFAITVLPFLAACQTDQIDIKTVQITPQIPVQPRPVPVRLYKNVRWYVVTEKTYNKFIKRYKRLEGTGTFYAISPNDYKKIALNIAELKRYIQQQKALIVYYEKAVQKEQK